MSYPLEFSIIQSKNIDDYKPILDGLKDVFDTEHFEATFYWCKMTIEKYYEYWEVYLIKWEDKTIGICGLYSLNKNSTEELWLTWFGLIPEYRNKGIGTLALEYMKIKAISLRCKRLMSYVEEEGKALPFYYRNGFKRISSVKEYLFLHPELPTNEFGEDNDHIIEFML